jgi:sortase A
VTQILPRLDGIRWIRRILVTFGISILAYCGYVMAESWIFQQAENRQLNQLLAHHREIPRPAALAVSQPTADGLIGRIDIPRLNVSVMVMEGADKGTLQRAAGHIPGTALPGEVGNVGISAHRDTYFRPLRNIKRSDIITLTTALGEYHYRVLSTKVVSPYDVAVLNPSADQTLTLVTCYPFYFVGAAPFRFIVRAERVQ